MEFEEFLTNASALFDEAAAGVVVTVERGGQVFRLASVRRRKRPKRGFSKDDALWDIVGMVNTHGPGDVSENKHDYLADAYADLHEPSPGPDQDTHSASATHSLPLDRP